METRGVWIPIEIMSLEGIDMVEAAILSKAQSFQAKGLDFYTSRESLAEEFLSSRVSIWRKEKHLEELGYISITNVSSRKRIISLRFKMNSNSKLTVQNETYALQNETVTVQNETVTVQNEAPLVNYINKEINKDINMGNDVKKDFDLFWESYPRKKKKKDAEKAFNKSTSLPPIEEHIKIIEAWKVTDQWTKDNGTYIPYPTTWLNGELWNDELPSKKINIYEGLKTYGRCDKCGKENNLINNVCIDCIKEQNNVA